MALGSEIAVERESVTWEVGPTKDVIQAFIERLVDPKLPNKFSINDPPSEDSKKSIARQAHVVYSLSKEKSAAQFYIMKCKQSFSTNQRSPLESLLTRMEGPFAKNYGDAWESTDLVEYLCVLPYKGLISSWLPRKDLSVPIFSNFIPKITKNKDVNESIPSRTRSGLNFHQTKTHGNVTDESKIRRDIPDSTSTCSTRGVIRDDSASGQHDANGPKKGVNSKVDTVDILKSADDQYKHERIAAENGGATISTNQNPIAAPENVKVHVEVPYNAEGENAMPSEDCVNALAILDKRRQGLYSHHCTIEDTLASYEHMIYRIRNGGESGLARQCMESFMSGSDPLLLNKKSQVQGKDGKDPSNPQPEKRSIFANIFVPGRSSCEDLEITCVKNGWTLPRYCVLPLDGKFLSNVIVCTGTSATLTSKGASESTPVEARESAAAQMIAQIRALASH